MGSSSRKRRRSESTSPGRRPAPQRPRVEAGLPACTTGSERPAHTSGQTIENSGPGEVTIGRDNIVAGRDVYISMLTSVPVLYSQVTTRLGNADSGNDAACLRDLRATDPRDDKSRIQQTKGGLLRNSYRWILEKAEFRRWRDDPSSRLLWVKGDPGKGKTMLLCGIIDELDSVDPSPCYFFCQGTDERINNATAVLRGLIYMLVVEHPSLVAYLRQPHGHAGKALFEDTNALFALTKILEAILQELGTVYVVIDALDECIKDLPLLLEFISGNASKSSGTKWLVSSRNIVEFEHKLQINSSGTRLSLELRQNAEQVSLAVDAYIEHCVSELPVIRHDVMLQDQVRHQVRQKANGTFLWASLVFQELRGAMKWDVLTIIDEVPTELVKVYERMLEQIRQRGRNSDLCREILSTVTAAYRPLHLKELHVLTGRRELRDANDAMTAVALCGSFLTVRDQYIYMIHQSAKDYLSTDGSPHIFPSGIESVHNTIFSNSIEVLSKSLRQDVYSLRVPGFSIDRVSELAPDPLGRARYSCVYWVDHLYVCKYEHLYGGGMVDVFLRQNFLFWLEALALLKSIPSGVLSIAKLDKTLQVRFTQLPLPYGFLTEVRYWQVDRGWRTLFAMHTASFFSIDG